MLKLILSIALVGAMFMGYSWYKDHKSVPATTEALPSLVITTTNPVPGSTLS